MDETAPLTTVRMLLLWTLVCGAAGMMTELLLIGHDESWSQLVPLFLLAAGLVVSAVVLVVPTQATLRLLQVLMVLFVGSGALGIALHYQGNAEFELEMAPSLSGVDLMSKTFTGATPVLAPGTMALLGMIGLTSTYRHPRLRSGGGSQEAQP